MKEEIPSFVRGVVYEACCSRPDGSRRFYYGQTRTHILNHGVYRPFGTAKRWRQHLSEAKINNATRQSRKLNNSIRKYGAEAFTVETLWECPLESLDSWERFLIDLCDSVRVGLNLQHGGGAGTKNSEESKAKIAATLRALGDKRRIEKFSDYVCRTVHLEKYQGTGVRVVVNRGGHTDFYGRRATLAESLERALAFARQLPFSGEIEILSCLQGQLPLSGQDNQIAGNPLSL